MHVFLIIYFFLNWNSLHARLDRNLQAKEEEKEEGK